MFVLIFGFSSVSAAPGVGGKVTALYIKKDGLVLFKIGENPPSVCADNKWPFKFYMQDTAAKEWVSMLLAARTSGQTIKVGYSPTDGSRCAPVYIYYRD
jgi:hypothetical protein